jgi:hypothetical protein
VPVARIDINRIDIAVVLSLLAHGLIAAIPVLDKQGERAASLPPMTFDARIVDAIVARAEPIQEPQPKVVRPQPVISPKTAVVPPPKAVEPIKPVERAETPPTPKFDMLAMINARRERRQQVEDSIKQQEQARSASPAGSSDPLATINRNLQGLSSATEDGTGGVFQILSKGTRTGEFAFNGFRPDTQRRWREVIEVDAGQGGDVERAMVRRMIELIRGHYTGNFIWRSHKLGKSVTMSARPEDGPELEDFLMREFFDTPTVAQKNGHRP